MSGPPRPGVANARRLTEEERARVLDVIGTSLAPETMLYHDKGADQLRLVHQSDFGGGFQLVFRGGDETSDVDALLEERACLDVLAVLWTEQAAAAAKTRDGAAVLCPSCDWAGDVSEAILEDVSPNLPHWPASYFCPECGEQVEFTKREPYAMPPAPPVRIMPRYSGTAMCVMPCEACPREIVVIFVVDQETGKPLRASGVPCVCGATYTVELAPPGSQNLLTGGAADAS